MRNVTRVIADDLTGAADSAIAFATGYQAVQLLLTEDHPHWTSMAVDIAVLDAGTRQLSPADAAARATALTRTTLPTTTLLKKIDSLLRGNIAVELSATRTQLPERLPVLAPAFPAAGRTTRDGRQLVDGRPLGDTTLWRMETEPPPTTIADAIAPLWCAAIGLEVVRGHTDRLASALTAASLAGSVAVCDAETDDDLAAIVTAGHRARPEPLWIGSAGLAAALATDKPSHGDMSGAPAGTWLPGAFLAVIGSASGLARQQAAALVEAGAHEIAVPIALLVDGLDRQRHELASRLATAAADGDVVVRLHGRQRREHADLVAARLASLVAPAAMPASLLVLTGGRTARTVLDSCGRRALAPIYQPEPGAVLSRTDAGTAVLTKAGAFGDRGTLLRCIDSVRTGRPTPSAASGRGQVATPEPGSHQEPGLTP